MKPLWTFKMGRNVSPYLPLPHPVVFCSSGWQKTESFGAAWKNEPKFRTSTLLKKPKPFPHHQRNL